MPLIVEQPKTWSGPIIAGQKYNQSLPETLLHHMKMTPEKVYQISDDEQTTMTYGELHLLSVRVAQNLIKLGVNDGDVVGIMLMNTTLLAPIAIGCFLINAVVNPLMPWEDVNKELMMANLEVSEPKFIVTYSQVVESVSNILQELKSKCKIFKEDLLLEETGTEEEFKLLNIKSNDETVVIMPSSGTTGNPKSIKVSGATCLRLQHSLFAVESSVIFTFSSFNWITGLYFLLFPIFRNCIRIVTKSRFTPELFIHIMKTHQVTHLFCSEFTRLSKYSKLCASDLKSVTTCYSAGNPVTDAVREKMIKLFPNNTVLIIYGSTEFGNVAAHRIDLNESSFRGNIVGKLVPNVSMKIVDDDGECLGCDNIGEIIVKPQVPFNGYYNNAAATKTSLDCNGWFKSGDMGYFDASGYLYVTGRKCDEIRYLKMKIQPVDIENVIHQIGGIEAACAFGIPDSIYGMIPAVAVVKSKNSKVTKEIIQLAVAEKFSGPQYGKTGLSSDNVQVHFFDSLSRLQSTHVKIDRLTIRQKIIKSPSTLYQKASQNLIVDLNDKFSLMSSKVSIS